ncbi:sialin [Aplysia californica]|uniref:Sialin n=1 Tax=Aplysia californica TaxID=6500 RepID=A0ABM0K3B4_APLCA|nr:sialin [Aplysia californica]
MTATLPEDKEKVAMGDEKVSTQGVSFPCMHSMWGRWAPAMERTRLASFTYAGTTVGNVITYIVSGLLCVYGFDNGWASIFYLTGGTAFIWLFVWFGFVSDSPEDHPSISQTERDYIVSHRGDRMSKKFKVPWKSVVRSRAMWVCLVAHVCKNWIHYTLLTGLPTFMKQVLKYDIKQNGVLSSVPYLAMIVTVLLSGHLADCLRHRYLSTTHTRRLFQSLSFLGSGACIVAVGFIDCERRSLAVVVLTLAVALEGLSYAGYMVNQVDFAPRYAGVLYGITNFISTIPGILAPIVTGKLTPNNDQSEWCNVFYVCGAFTVVGTVVFGGFASGEIEPWAAGDGGEGGEGDVNDMEVTVKPDTADVTLDNTGGGGGHCNKTFSKLDQKSEENVCAG